MSAAPSAKTVDAPTSRFRRGLKHLDTFWRQITEGVELEDLWRQFKTEARSSYGLYSREVDWDKIKELPNWKKPFQALGSLFWALLMKLSPARRVLLLIAVVLLLWPETQWRSGRLVIGGGYAGLGAALLFVLLALELADRVTMKRDLEIAREIQRLLVPAAPPQVPGVDIAFATRPANTVAGDYYDAFVRQDGSGQAGRGPLLVVVADVAGKSVPAALLMATFQSSLQALAASSMSLEELVAGLNRYACLHSLGGLRFTTAFLAQLDAQAAELEYVNAGHNAPVLWRASGRFERLEAGAVPLGIAAETLYRSSRVAVSRGDLLVIFTDGLVEAVNDRGEEYGELRLIQLLQAGTGATADASLRRLMSHVEMYAGTTPQHDDITCLVLRVV
jgi:phosphoserine phosphatase RsbU/P